MLKIAIGQMKVVPGALETNFQTISKMVDNAKKMGADLVVFPELCVSGTLVGDRFHDQAFCNDLEMYNDKIRELSDSIGIIWGSVTQREIHGIKYGRDGRRVRYNVALFAYKGRWMSHENTSLYEGMYIKQFTKNTRFNDESRYFLSANDLNNYEGFDKEANQAPFMFKDHRLGVLVGEDLWNHEHFEDVTESYTILGAKYIINIAASPWINGKEQARNRQILEKCQKNALPILFYVNSVGCQNTGKNVLVFDGGSTVYGHFGDPILHCNDAFVEELKFYEGRSEPINYCNNKLLEALTYGIREFDAQVFSYGPKWIIGLSGGLDSCVSCALLVRALGPERVLGYNLATDYNSQETIGNAQSLANALHIEIRNGNIEQLVNATRDVVINNYKYHEEDIKPFAMENVQARIRGHLLSTFAAIHNGVISNNGNKVEALLGYCTLYGDTIGALAILGDLLKTDLFELSKQINEEYRTEVIPTRLLPVLTDTGYTWEMMPSAELKEKQTDPMKWFYHDAIVDYLTMHPTYGAEKLARMYSTGELSRDPRFGKWLSFYGLDRDPRAFCEDLEWILKQMRISVFKRIQMPPILTVSKGAFGNDFRECQINVDFSEEYIDIKERLLGRRI